MRNMSFLYRILLPPIFLFRFCSPRPPDDAVFHERNYFSQKHINNISSTFVNSKNKSVDILNWGSVNLKNITENLMIFGENYTRSQSTVVNSNNFTNSVTTPVFPSQLFNSENGLSSDRKIPQQTKHYEPDVPILLLNNIFHTNKHSNKSFGEDLQNGLQSPRHFSKSDSNQGTGHQRTRRDVDTTTSNKDTPQHATPPEYMIHLFQLLFDTHYDTLRNFVVTGFVNINKNRESRYIHENSGTRGYTLVFDVQISHEAETIHYTELRVYVTRQSRLSNIGRDNETANNYPSPQYNITVYELFQYPDKERRQISFKAVKSFDEDWLSFNVTSAVQSWTTSGERVLEVTFDLCENGVEMEKNVLDNKKIDDLALNLDNNNGKGPLLVVFSKKHVNSEHVLYRRSVREATHTDREVERLLTKVVHRRSSESNNKGSVDFSKDLYFQGVVKFISTVTRESANSFDDKILTPTDIEYSQAITHKKSEKWRNNNDAKSTFLQAKDNDQSKSSISNFAMFSGDDKEEDVKEAGRSKSLNLPELMKAPKFRSSRLKQITSEDVVQTRMKRGVKTRYRRNLDSQEVDDGPTRKKRSKKKRASCQRSEMYVDFETIKWDKVIIFPRGYQAFECTGKCYTPISEYLTPSKHAIIQTLLHTSYPEQASRACCVPTKLDPISVLYWDENGDIKYDYTYEGMMVAECGCR